MTKIEDYTARAAASLSAYEAAKSERDRLFHHRAYSSYRKILASLVEAEERAATQPERLPSDTAYRNPARPRM